MSDSKTVDDGGPAFPGLGASDGYGNQTPVMLSNGSHLWQELNQGMTLRDWFAGQALEGYMSILDSRKNPDYQEDATFMYQMADAMIAARKELHSGEATKAN